MRRQIFDANLIGRWAATGMFVWLGLTVAGIVVEQILIQPPPPATPAEIAAATPKARADWKIVSERLARRLPKRPLELGMVWSTHAGRICGLVNHSEAGVDNMTRFYAIDLVPVLQEDDPRRYVREWLYCIGDYVVELHPGSQDTGFCASAHGRATPIGPLLCGAEWFARPRVRRAFSPDTR